MALIFLAISISGFLSAAGGAGSASTYASTLASLVYSSSCLESLTPSTPSMAIAHIARYLNICGRVFGFVFLNLL